MCIIEDATGNNPRQTPDYASYILQTTGKKPNSSWVNEQHKRSIIVKCYSHPAFPIWPNYQSPHAYGLLFDFVVRAFHIYNILEAENDFRTL